MDNAREFRFGRRKPKQPKEISPGEENERQSKSKSHQQFVAISIGAVKSEINAFILLFPKFRMECDMKMAN